ncbi:MAG: histidine triad nucleotide-binding protein [Candidatus Kapabacteria bacterium]|nr:histidine triad nucleotide-binding protein [Candidatus Kapabacteria bacterium]
MSETIFDKIIRKEIPSQIEYEDEEILAFKDIEPKAPFHVLIIPKKDIPTVNDITEADAELVGKIFIVAAKLAKKYGIDEKGYRLVFNCNEDAGQTVFHLHCHFMGGRKMLWPAG